MTSPTSCLTPEKGKVPSAAFTASPRRGEDWAGSGWGDRFPPPHPPVPRQTFRMGGEAAGEKTGEEKGQGEYQPQRLSRKSALLPRGSESPSNFLKVTELVSNGDRSCGQVVLLQSLSRRSASGEIPGHPRFWDSRTQSSSIACMGQVAAQGHSDPTVEHGRATASSLRVSGGRRLAMEKRHLEGPGPALHPTRPSTLAPRRSWSMVFSASAYLVRSLW